MTVHHFQPDHYHTALGPYEPVLRIADGDSVATTTVDARGFDSANTQITTPGNPQTGPFYVQEAEPGDTLEVHLDRLTPNRSGGWSGSVLAPNVVDPQSVGALPQSRTVSWRIDTESRLVRFENPPPSLAQVALPLAPMVGCFGVAPAGGQAISAATSAEHGGNMDYRGFVEGVTVYFPVFEPGALFFLGDGHAVQGDGEIVGSGVETSFDVQFTVRLHRGKTIYWPRGEDSQFIFTVGNARPLDQALQHATTEMLRWLQADYGLDLAAAGTLMGQSVAYEVGNVFDPAYTMVCKMSKKVLADLVR